MRTENAREIIDQAGPAVTAAGKIRYLKPDQFDGIDAADMEKLARNLRALSHSCLEGARLVEKTARART